jgi:hypothetical protein
MPVVVTVTGQPVASAGRALTLKNAPVEVDLRPWVYAFETPPERLFYAVGQPASGAVTLLAERHMARFTPASNFTGSAAFDYVAGDVGIDARLLLYFDMEQEAVTLGGAVSDVSGNGRDGALEVVGTGNGALTNSTPQALAPGRALLLSERGDLNGACVRRLVGTNELHFSDQSWTFSGWFNRASQANDDFIFYLGNGDGFGSNEEFHLYGAVGSTMLSLKHFIGQNVTDIDLNASGVSLGAWHHVAVTFARTNTAAGVVSLYVDGALKGADGSFALRLDQTQPVVFGGHTASNNAVTRWFNGLLDDLAVFHGALTADEVSALAARSVAHFGGLSATNAVAVRVLATDAAPVMSASGWAGGAWAMTVNGPSDLSYTVEVSTNLATWLPLETRVSPALPFLWSDPDAAALPRRFYRVRLDP